MGAFTALRRVNRHLCMQNAVSTCMHSQQNINVSIMRRVIPCRLSSSPLTYKTGWVAGSVAVKCTARSKSRVHNSLMPKTYAQAYYAQWKCFFWRKNLSNNFHHCLTYFLFTRKMLMVKIKKKWFTYFVLRIFYANLWVSDTVFCFYWRIFLCLRSFGLLLWNNIV